MVTRLKKSPTNDWYINAILDMLTQYRKEITDIEITEIKHVINAFERESPELNDKFFFLDQLLRRLDILFNLRITDQELVKCIKPEGSISEIVLVCAMLANKIASDQESLWNIDFVGSYNSQVEWLRNKYKKEYDPAEFHKVSKRKYWKTCDIIAGKVISLERINMLEAQHLDYLNWVTDFGNASKRDVRLFAIFKHISLSDLPKIENELQGFRKMEEGLSLGKHIQKAIFIKSSLFTQRFFDKCGSEPKVNCVVSQEKIHSRPRSRSV